MNFFLCVLIMLNDDNEVNEVVVVVKQPNDRLLDKNLHFQFLYF